MLMCLDGGTKRSLKMQIKLLGNLQENKYLILYLSVRVILRIVKTFHHIICQHIAARYAFMPPSNSKNFKRDFNGKLGNFYIANAVHAGATPANLSWWVRRKIFKKKIKK